eukprot:TRINITY_DN11196_c0_g1_i1.p1 TRINITY_DN11196_c0_g1~~TRINITY_DN11196_c0_g1_i1.p1  ORF type:complete len:389 (+),score=110.74 TRINITY_DN11196_c0_g1_i1:204-1370(+)
MCCGSRTARVAMLRAYISGKMKLLLLLGVVGLASGCTHFVLSTPEGEVLGRTMELGGLQPPSVEDPLPWDIVKVPKGRQFEPSRSDSCQGQGVSGWTSVYNFVGLGVATNLYRVIDGVNEEGLSIGHHTLRMSEYQVPVQGKQSICWDDFSTWLLSTCPDVASVIKALQNTSLVALPSYSTGSFAHWSVSDRHHNNIVVEYIKGELKIHNNTVKVLTNDPPFDWQLLNLNQYVMLNTEWSRPGKVQVETELGPIPDQISHGLNTIGLPGDFSPPGRFARIFYMKQFAEHNTPPRNVAEGIDLATGLINSVHIPKGVVAHKGGIDNDGTWDYTQFATIKVPGQQLYYIRTYNNNQWRLIDLNKVSWNLATLQPLYTEEHGIKDISHDLI